MIRPKQFARMGEFYLEEAILDVLLEAKHQGQCIGAAAIGKRTGIFGKSGDEKKGEVKNWNDGIVTGCLNKMMQKGRVQRCKQAGKPASKDGGWELTDAEFDRRRDDIDVV